MRYMAKSPRGRAPPAIKDGGKENENRRSLAAPPAGSKLKTWIAETLPRTTREFGAWIEAECGITYESRSGLIARLHRPGMAGDSRDRSWYETRRRYGVVLLVPSDPDDTRQSMSMTAPKSGSTANCLRPPEDPVQQRSRASICPIASCFEIRSALATSSRSRSSPSTGQFLPRRQIPLVSRGEDRILPLTLPRTSPSTVEQSPLQHPTLIVDATSMRPADLPSLHAGVRL